MKRIFLSDNLHQKKTYAKLTKNSEERFDSVNNLHRTMINQMNLVPYFR